MDLVIEETDSLPPAPAAVAAMPPYRPGRPSLSPRLSPVSNNDHAHALCADQVRPAEAVPAINREFSSVPWRLLNALSTVLLMQFLAKNRQNSVRGGYLAHYQKQNIYLCYYMA